MAALRPLARPFVGVAGVCRWRAVATAQIWQRQRRWASTAGGADNTSQRWSVDSDEVAKFAAMAQKWWDPFGPFMPLQQMNPIRVDFIRSSVERQQGVSGTDARPLAGLNVLDIGCGGGILAESLARLGGQVLAIDASADNIDAARSHATRDPALHRNLEYRAVTAETQAQEGREFDIVVASELLEHVNRPHDFLSTCASLLKPNGMFFVTTINRTPAAFAKTVLAAEYLLRWVPVGTHEFKKYVRPEELESLLHSRGLAVTDKKGVDFDVLSRQWRFTDSLDTNYFLAARKLPLPQAQGGSRTD